jgi:hypothetical protein
MCPKSSRTAAKSPFGTERRCIGSIRACDHDEDWRAWRSRWTGAKVGLDWGPCASAHATDVGSAPAEHQGQSTQSTSYVSTRLGVFAQQPAAPLVPDQTLELISAAGSTLCAADGGPVACWLTRSHR